MCFYSQKTFKHIQIVPYSLFHQIRLIRINNVSSLFIQNPTSPHICHLIKGAKYGLYFIIYKKVPITNVISTSVIQRLLLYIFDNYLILSSMTFPSRKGPLCSLRRANITEDTNMATPAPIVSIDKLSPKNRKP